MHQIGQLQVSPKEANLIRPNTPWHYELKPPGSIVQLNGTVLTLPERDGIQSKYKSLR